MKKCNKGILKLFLLILLMISFISIHSVNAVTNSNTSGNTNSSSTDVTDINLEENNQRNSLNCKDSILRSKYGSLYNLELGSVEGSNHAYKLTLKVNNVGVENPPTEFKVIRVLESNITSDNIGSYYSYLKNKNSMTVYADYNTESLVNQALGNVSGKVLTPSNSLTVNLSNIAKNNRRVYIILASTTYNKDFITDCNNKYKDPSDKDKRVERAPFIIYQVIDVYKSGNIIPAPPGPYIVENPNAEIKKISCANYESVYTNKDSFEYKYCVDKTNADAAVKKGTGKEIDFGLSTKNEIITYADHIANHPEDALKPFQCDPFLNIPTAPSDPDKIEDHQKQEEYKPYNTNYLIGNVKEQFVVGHLIYNFGGQSDGTEKDKDGNTIPKGRSVNPDNIKTDDIKCEISCTEVVTVQYGAPVASKAGLCFEYKVKVTSRVNCGSKVTANLNPPPRKLCTPYAHCWDPEPPCSLEEHTCPGDGPVDDYDACINECDGGQYGMACSTYCYNKVYGSSKISAKTNFGSDFAELVRKIKNTARLSDEVCAKSNPHFEQKVYSNGSKKLIFTPAGCVAPMYNDLKKNLSCTKDESNGGGIPCTCSCSLLCEWLLTSPCSVKTDYLNDEEFENDRKKNQEYYDEAVTKCSQFAKCSTTEAEYIIETDYTLDGGKQKETIHFPYDNNKKDTKDTSQFKSSGEISCTSGKINTTLLPIDENQCYRCKAKDNNGSILFSRTYMMEWGFPGFYASGKSDQISYQFKQGWIKVNGEFCIPQNADDVNQKWWNAYYIAQSGFTNNSLTDTTYDEKKNCTIDCSSYKLPTPDTNFNITYNIRANTQKFGLFGWDIAMECFYATNSQFPYEPGGTSCNTNCKIESDYEVRSVKLDDMFPATSGEGHGTDQVGREPGFNWTDYAKNDKTTKFESDPSAYTTWVQELAYDVYSDQYLDYEIYLSKNDIYALRQRQKGMKGFNNVSEDVEATASKVDYDAVSHYQSDLFRGDSKLLQKANVPSTIALRCNNIRNWKDDSCFDGEDR